MHARGHYGRLWPSYWTGPTGRAIQEAGGAAATLLGCYLVSNRFTNMIGLYTLSPRTITAELPLAAADLAPAWAALAGAEFAHYHAATGSVWVVSLLEARLGLAPTRRTLEAARAWCARSVENFFYPQFIHRNVATLDRNISTPIAIDHNPLGAAKTALSTTVRTAERNTRARAETRAPDQLTFPFELYTIVAKDAIAKVTIANPDPSFADLRDAFKTLCARRHLTYAGELATHAIAAALKRRPPC